MTVNNPTSKIIYNGNGATTVFSFPFSCPSASNVLVYIKDAGGIVTQIPPANAIVALNAPIGTNPTPAGGTVTFFGIVPAIGTQVAIVRSLAFVQTLSLGNQSIIYPAVVEKQLDYITMLIQQGEQIVTPFSVEEDDA